MSDEGLTMSRRARHVESMVLSFDDNIKKVARKNLAFRKAIYTGAFSELAVMSIPPRGSWAKRHTTMAMRSCSLSKAKEK